MNFLDFVIYVIMRRMVDVGKYAKEREPFWDFPAVGGSAGVAEFLRGVAACGASGRKLREGMDEL